MKIFHYDWQTGALLGEGLADESPLEPGVWLIPAQATDVVPPEPLEGHQVVWTGEEWIQQALPEPAADIALEVTP